MGGRKVFFGILSVLISFNFLFSPIILNLSRAIDIKTTEEQSHKLSQKNEELHKELEKTENNIICKKKEIEDLQKKIEDLSLQINNANKYLLNLNQKIDNKMSEIVRLEAKVNEKMNLLMQRVRVIYKSGEVCALDILLGAKSFDDLIDKMDLISRLSEYDSKLVSNINNSINLLDADRKHLEEDKSRLVLEKVSFEEKEKNLSDLLLKYQEILSCLKEKKNEEQNSINENDLAYKELQNQISKYYEEQAKKRTLSLLNNKKDVANNNAKSVNKIVNGMNNCKIVAPSGKAYEWPVPSSRRISSVFMEKRGDVYHKGIDISAPNGSAVLSADDGVVIVSYNGCTHNYGKSNSCGCGGGYGNYIFIDHGAGRCTVYGHLSLVNVSSGQKVSKGQVIGKVGSTGHSTGPHLHFECRKNNLHYNPMSEYN